MPPRLLAALRTVGACLAGWLGWTAAGWAIAAAGFGELDLPARVAGVFAALALLELAPAYPKRRQ